MKNKFIFIVCLTLSVICLCAVTSCDDVVLYGGGKSQDRVVNTGLLTVEDITEANDGEECDKDSGCISEGRLYFHTSGSSPLLLDSNGSLMWLYSEDESVFEGLESGDYVKVSHGYVMESYPAQTYASQITVIESGDISSFTDEEWERLEGVIVGIERK